MSDTAQKGSRAVYVADAITSASYALYLIGTAILNAKTIWSLLQSVLAAEEKFGKACNFVFAGKCQGYMEDLKTASLPQSARSVAHTD